MEEAYTAYFAQQAGAGRGGANPVGPVYEASYIRQNGRGGCCGLTGRYLTAIATPLIVKGMRAVGEEAANAAFGYYRDVTAAQEPLTFRAATTAAATRLSEAGRNLKRRARHALTGRGRKRTSKKAVKKRKKPVRPKKKPKKKLKASRKHSKAQKGRGRTRGHTEADSTSPPVDIFS